MNIDLRNIDTEFEEAILNICKRIDEKTASKALRHATMKYDEHIQEIAKLKKEIQKQNGELIALLEREQRVKRALAVFKEFT